MAGVSPMHVVGVLIVDQHQLGFEFRQRTQAQGREQTIAARVLEPALAVVALPVPPKCFEARRLRDGVAAQISRLHLYELLFGFDQRLAVERAGCDLLAQQIGLELMQAKDARAIAHAVMRIGRERQEIFVLPVLAVDDQRLMVGHVVSLTQVFEQRRNLRLEAFAQEFSADVFIAVVASGQNEQRALRVAGVDTLARLDAHLRIERALLAQHLREIGAVGILRVDRLAPPHATAIADDDDVGAGIGALSAQRFLRGGGASGESKRGKGEVAAAELQIHGEPHTRNGFAAA